VCVCACAQGSYFEGHVSVVICPTITVLYHISGNFSTARRILVPTVSPTSSPLVLATRIKQLA
jgi:hypothetical protein